MSSDQHIPKPIPITLEEVIEETPGVRSFRFGYEKSRFSYKASQAVRLIMNVNGETVYHPFSIASSPTEEFLQFTTRIRSESAFKQRLADLRSGDNVTIAGPGGRFTLPDTAGSDTMMIGGGIGVTPFRSMAKFATDMKLPHRITLLYSSRTPDGIVYRKEWEEMQKNNQHLKVVCTITRPEGSGESWAGRTGRIDESFIKSHVNDPHRTLFFLCGTPTMTAAMASLLRGIGVEGGRLLVENFHGYN